MRSRDYKLVLGTKTIAQMASETKIADFPLQSDMKEFIWYAPSDVDAAIPRYPVLSQSLSGLIKPSGFLELEFVFDFLTPLQFKYLTDTFFASNVFYSVVTVQTYNESNEAIVINCVAKRPHRTENLRGELRGVEATIEFFRGVLAS